MQSAAALLLAVTFGAAAVAKSRARITFRASLRDLLPRPFVRPVAELVPVVEVATALLIVSGIAPREAAIAAIALLTLFSLALLRMWRLGSNQECACFGEAAEAATPASGLVRNTLLAIGAASIIATPDGAGFGDLGALLANITLVAGVIALWSAAVTVATFRTFLFHDSLGGP